MEEIKPEKVKRVLVSPVGMEFRLTVGPSSFGLGENQDIYSFLNWEIMFARDKLYEMNSGEKVPKRFEFVLYTPIYFDPIRPIYDVFSWANSSEWNFGLSPKLPNGEREEDWNPADMFRDILMKIKHLRYGKKGERGVFINLGNIDLLEFSHGIVVDRYTNSLFFPQSRTMGFQLDGRAKGADFELFASNLDFSKGIFSTVAGTSAMFRLFAATEVPILRSIGTGVFLVVDTDPREGERGPLYYVDENGMLDPTIQLTGFPIPHYYGMNYEVKWVETFNSEGKKNPATVMTYLDIIKQDYLGNVNGEDQKLFKKIIYRRDGKPNEERIRMHWNNSLGWMLGLKGKIAHIFDYRVEFRRLIKGFVPNYFSFDYELNKGTYEKLNQVVANSGATYNGMLFGFGVDMVDPYGFKFYVSYQEVLKDPTRNNMLHLEFILDKDKVAQWMPYPIPPMGFKFIYDRLRIKNFREFWNNFNSINSIFSFQYTIQLAQLFDFSVIYRKYFHPDSSPSAPRNEQSLAFETTFTF